MDLTHDVEGWDRFTNVNLIGAIQTRSAIKLWTHAIEGLTKVGDLVGSLWPERQGPR